MRRRAGARDLKALVVVIVQHGQGQTVLLQDSQNVLGFVAG